MSFDSEDDKHDKTAVEMSRISAEARISEVAVFGWILSAAPGQGGMVIMRSPARPTAVAIPLARVLRYRLEAGALRCRVKRSMTGFRGRS
jgi:hypothetical protein